LISAALVAANIIDGDGGGISQIQNLVDCIRYKSVELFLADTLFASRCIALSYDCFASSTRAVTSAVHDRMPVILDPGSYYLWLDPGMQNVAAISELLKPYDARMMRCFPVSIRVNHVANDDEECAPAGTESARKVKELDLLNNADRASREYKKNLCELEFAGFDGGSGASSAKSECEYSVDRQYVRQVADAILLKILAK